MPRIHPYSLRRRMLIISGLVLLMFIIITALILDQAFKSSLQIDLQDRLNTQLYLVLGAAEFESESLQLPKRLNYPKLDQLNSGSLAWVLSASGEEVWRSDSAQNLPQQGLNNSLQLLPGDQQQGEITIQQFPFFYSSQGVAWESTVNSELIEYTFIIAEQGGRFQQSIGQYRMYLWLGLSLLALILLAVFTVTLYWGLQPLKQLAHDLNLIETGKTSQLTGHYPKELIGVADNLNRLLQHEKRQHTRYHNTLSNLAHSLKTPLAVLRGLVDKHYYQKSTAENRSFNDDKLVDSLASQVTRMDEIVQHQLQRASHVGPQSIQQSIKVLPLVESLVSVIEKIYQESLMCVDFDVEPGVVFKGAKGDLMEVLGNLLDNSAKYGGGIISLLVTNEKVDGLSDKLLRCRIVLEDNGIGINDESIADILRRGVRADQKQQGQGIGLAMVVDIIDQYQGKLHLSRSSLGGLKVEILI